MMISSTSSSRLFLVFILLSQTATSFSLQKEWSTKLPESAYIEPYCSESYIYVATSGGLRVFDYKGSQIELIDLGQVATSIMSMDGLTYVGTKEGYLVLDRSFNRLYEIQTSHRIDHMLPYQRGLIVSGGRGLTYVGGNDEIHWSYNVSHEIDSVSLVEFGQDLRLVASVGGLLYLMKMPPYKVDIFPAEGEIAPNPVPMGSGVVLGTTSGKAYSLLIERGLEVEWEKDYPDMIEYAISLYDFNEGENNIVFYSGGSLIQAGQDGNVKERYTIEHGASNIRTFSSKNSTYVIYSRSDEVFVLKGLRNEWIHRFDRSVDYILVTEFERNTRILFLCSDDSIHLFSVPPEPKKRIADNYMDSAEKAYLEHDRFSCLAYIAFAKELYSNINDSRGLMKAENLESKIEADELLALGDAYLEIGHFSNASEYAGKAYEIYSIIGDGKGMLDAESLISAAVLKREADLYYNMSIEELSELNYLKSREYAVEASKIYRRLNGSYDMSESIMVVEKAVTKAKGDFLYRMALKSYYNESSISKALYYLNISSTEYEKIGDTRGLRYATDFRNRIESDLKLSEARSNRDFDLDEESIAADLNAESDYDFGAETADDMFVGDDTEYLGYKVLAFFALMLLVFGFLWYRK